MDSVLGRLQRGTTARPSVPPSIIGCSFSWTVLKHAVLQWVTGSPCFRGRYVETFED